MNKQEFLAELRQLAARIGRIERQLGLGPPVAPTEREREPSAAAEPVAPPPVTPMREPTPAPAAACVERAAEPAPAPPAPAPALRPAPQPPLVVKPPRAPLEVLIGERWMAWVGAIIVVAAVGFFVKLAYDYGWWGHLAPIAKCLVAAGFGGALLAAGEVALRRVGRRAAVSLYSAGLGTLYLTAYSTFRFFDLLSQTGAFWLMLLVALLGVGLTLRGRMLVIGILSLAGGYLSPVLLAEQVTFAAGLPLYATGLLVVALALSARMPEPFRPLRYVGVALHAALATLWILHEGTAHWLLAISFMTLWWLLVTGEAVWAALRNQSARGNPLIALLFTIWYISFGCNVLADVEPLQLNWLGIFTGAVAAVCAWVALGFGAGLAVLKTRPRQAMELLAATLWVQAGVLVATAIGLNFRGPGEGFGQTIGWLAMGVACVEVGRRLPSRGVDVFGLLVAAAGLWRLWALDSQNTALQTTVWAYGSLSIYRWTMLALGAVLATHFIARRLRTGGDYRWWKFCAFIAFLGTVQWVVVCTPSCGPGLTLTMGWLLAVVVLLALAPIGQSPGYRGLAAFVLTIAVVKWLVADAALTRVGPGWNAAASLPVLNWQMGVAALTCGCLYWFYRPPSALAARPRRDLPAVVLQKQLARRSSSFSLVVGVLFLLVALSFEVERVIARSELAAPVGTIWLVSPPQTRILWWTLLWAAGGTVCTFVGQRRPLAALFSTGWALTWLAGIAWLAAGVLHWRITAGVALCTPFANVQFGVGLAVAVLFAAAAHAMARGEPAEAAGRVATDAQGTVVGAVVLALLAISMELDRLIGHAQAGGASALLGPWPAWQVRLLWWTALWAVAGLAMLLHGRARKWPVMFTAGALVVLAAGVNWLAFDTLFWRFDRGVVLARVVLNQQFAVGLVAGAVLVTAAVHARRCEQAGFWASWRTHLPPIAWGLVAAIGLWLGSLELDRLFAPEAQRVSNAAMARQTAWSVYWGLYAIGLVAVGFWRRGPAIRYAGLGLLAVTLAKVLIVDLAHLQYVYRVLSLLATGLLFILTSIAYARLAKQLEAQATRPTDAGEPARLRSGL